MIFSLTSFFILFGQFYDIAFSIFLGIYGRENKKKGVALYMIITTSNSGHTAYGLKDYVIDKKADLQNLPVDVPMGSTAFCIEDSSVYMINSSGEWVEI